MTICAGIHPNRVLPVVLDCGTDNKSLLNDPLYLGLKEKRVRGEKYDKLVETFISSARELYPKAYIHFEDFGLTNGESHNHTDRGTFLGLDSVAERQDSTAIARPMAPRNPVLQR